jgi:starch phosphorylase
MNAKPSDDAYLASLSELALNMRWSWNHATDEIWRRLDPELWARTNNPRVVLQTVSRESIEAMMADPASRKEVDELLGARRRAPEASAWFQKNHSRSALTSVAYFSMEFMLGEALPIYSGGLGNVAGDQLKAASDLGVPVIGVGLLYQQGYFRQVIDAEGEQEALFPYNDPGQLPIAPVRQKNGEWLRLEIALPGYSVWLRAWQVQVGRAKLYLLDSNDAANYPVNRGITSELYGGGQELRLRQEILLGIGGWRLLDALGVKSEVCHLNEGHAAFAVLERARGCMQETGLSFEAALAVTRAGNLFTAHTAVAAGFDRFAPALIEQYLGRYAQEKLKLSLRDLLALGRENPDDRTEAFNMAYLAIRGSGAVNGVSRLHGEVSRRLFAPLFPRWPAVDVPIGHITNGVHMPTWDSAPADDLWTEACGKGAWLGEAKDLGEDIRRVSDERLWRFRIAAITSFVEYARGRLSMQLAASGATQGAVDAAKRIFDPDVLTLDFARRFASYKRPTLLLQDPERLLRILSDRDRPVQLVVAGKSHPADREGQALIHSWIEFIRRPDVRPHAIFLADYDMLLTEHLAQGVDLWLNTPRRPWEASGTSGMKILANGGINLSELDGWWAEAYSPEVGWAIGDGREHGEDPNWDAIEADELYGLLEREVVPEFYERGENGIPSAWVRRMRESMAQLTPRFGGMRIETRAGFHEFEVEVFLGELDADSLLVELYADGIEGEPAQRVEMKRVPPSEGSEASTYRAVLGTKRPSSDFTARAVPRRAGVSIPLEFSRILWQ